MVMPWFASRVSSAARSRSNCGFSRSISAASTASRAWFGSPMPVKSGALRRVGKPDTSSGSDSTPCTRPNCASAARP